jgi:hypothetical protein
MSLNKAESVANYHHREENHLECRGIDGRGSVRVLIFRYLAGVEEGLNVEKDSIWLSWFSFLEDMVSILKSFVLANIPSPCLLGTYSITSGNKHSMVYAKRSICPATVVADCEVTCDE